MCPALPHMAGTELCRALGIGWGSFSKHGTSASRGGLGCQPPTWTLRILENGLRDLSLLLFRGNFRRTYLSLTCF